jgi:hypothetical protein
MHKMHRICLNLIKRIHKFKIYINKKIIVKNKLAGYQ